VAILIAFNTRELTQVRVRERHTGSMPAMSALGLGCVKTPAATSRLEQLASAALYESEFMLREHAQCLAWRIAFSTSFRCNSFHTWGNSGPTSDKGITRGERAASGFAQAISSLLLA
jgi:hypothetical protein